ncbi:MAG: hypothetical protein QM733_19620 [Ilumatobacteraceae bacterium]
MGEDDAHVTKITAHLFGDQFAVPLGETFDGLVQVADDRPCSSLREHVLLELGVSGSGKQRAVGERDVQFSDRLGETHRSLRFGKVRLAFDG